MGVVWHDPPKAKVSVWSGERPNIVCSMLKASDCPVSRRVVPGQKIFIRISHGQPFVRDTVSHETISQVQDLITIVVSMGVARVKGRWCCEKGVVKSEYRVQALHPSSKSGISRCPVNDLDALESMPDSPFDKVLELVDKRLQVVPRLIVQSEWR
jgi:hypothetical protein